MKKLLLVKAVVLVIIIFILLSVTSFTLHNIKKDLNRSNVSVIVKVGESELVNNARVELIQDNVVKYYEYTGSTGKAIFLGVTNGTYNIKAVKSGLGNGQLYNQIACCGWSDFVV